MQNLKDLAGMTVGQVFVDTRLGLWLEKSMVSIEVVFEQPAVFTEPGRKVTFDPANTATLSGIFGLLGKKISNVDVDGRMRLLLKFQDNSSIECPGDEKYEAWAINGPNIEMVGLIR